MKDIWLLLVHLLIASAKLLGSGGVKGIIAKIPSAQAAAARRLPHPATGTEFVSGQPIRPRLLLTVYPVRPHHEDGRGHSTLDAVAIA